MKTLLALSVLLLLMGCNSDLLTPVLPYERENLSTLKMSPGVMSERETFSGEVYGIREGVSLSSGEFAGGCGCK
jgi:type III secretory pathway lipoprotein EscJ